MSWSIPTGPDGFLTEEERAALTRLFDAVFPGNPARCIPTTTAANVVAFLDRLLSCDAGVYWEIPAWRTLYRDGLAALAVAARQRYDKELSVLPRPQVTELLQALERGELDMATPQRTLFRIMRSHCLQGCFADPGWGGNAEQMMWQWLGYRTEPKDIKQK